MNQPQPKSPLDHLAGMPPMLMMLMEERLQVRIREAIYESGTVAERGNPSMMGMAWRNLWAMDSDKIAKHILRRMMYKRMEAGKQFDSILESSRKYFAEAMMAAALGEK